MRPFCLLAKGTGSGVPCPPGICFLLELLYNQCSYSTDLSRVLSHQDKTCHNSYEQLLWQLECAFDYHPASGKIDKMMFYCRWRNFEDEKARQGKLEYALWMLIMCGYQLMMKVRGWEGKARKAGVCPRNAADVWLPVDDESSRMTRQGKESRSKACEQWMLFACEISTKKVRGWEGKARAANVRARIMGRVVINGQKACWARQAIRWKPHKIQGEKKKVSTQGHFWVINQQRHWSTQQYCLRGNIFQA